MIHIESLEAGNNPQDINNAIEHLVRKKLEQYLRIYLRFKQSQLSRENALKLILMPHYKTT